MDFYDRYWDFRHTIFSFVLPLAGVMIFYNGVTDLWNTYSIKSWKETAIFAIEFDVHFITTYRHSYWAVSPRYQYKIGSTQFIGNVYCIGQNQVLLRSAEEAEKMRKVFSDREWNSVKYNPQSPNQSALTTECLSSIKNTIARGIVTVLLGSLLLALWIWSFLGKRKSHHS